MENIINLDPRPRVLHPAFLRQLAEANRAERQLRGLNCRVLKRSISVLGTEIVVDHNPHRTLTGCPNVHVTCAPKAVPMGHGRAA